MGKQNPYHRAELFALVEGSDPPQYVSVVVNAAGKLVIANPGSGGSEGGGLTDDELRASPLQVDIQDATIAVTGALTDDELRASPLGVTVDGVATELTLAALDGKFSSEDDTAATVRDDYRSMESLEDQVGDGSVKTFTFSSDVHMLFVECVGGVGRATTSDAETPSVSRGVYCDDAVPTPIVVVTDAVKVFAPSDVTKIAVWGYRR